MAPIVVHLEEDGDEAKDANGFSLRPHPRRHLGRRRDPCLLWILSNYHV